MREKSEEGGKKEWAGWQAEKIERRDSAWSERKKKKMDMGLNSKERFEFEFEFEFGL